MEWALVKQDFGELLDKKRINHSGCDGSVTQNVLFHSSCLYDVPIEIDESLPVRKKEWSFSLNLPPDEHIFCGERNLLIPLCDVGLHRSHDVLLRKINLGIEIGHAELTSTAATCGHFDHSESRSLVREENLLA